jgi:hypothetical protein
MRRPADTVDMPSRAPRSGGELRDLWSTDPTEAASPLPTWTVHGLGGARVAVVEVGVLDRGLQDRHFAPPLRRREVTDVVEQLAARQLVDDHLVHGSTQAPSTDVATATTALLPQALGERERATLDT